MCVCSFFVSVLTFFTVITLGTVVVKRGKQAVKTDLPKKEVPEAEKERIKREAKRKEDEWNNFFSYSGETQTKRGGI